MVLEGLPGEKGTTESLYFGWSKEILKICKKPLATQILENQLPNKHGRKWVAIPQHRPGSGLKSTIGYVWTSPVESRV